MWWGLYLLPGSIHHERGRLIVGKILEMFPELIQGMPTVAANFASSCGSSKSSRRSRIMYRRAITYASRRYRPGAPDPARVTINERVERDRHEMPALHRDHGGVAALEQVLGRAVAEVARVLHIVRDRDRRSAARSRCSWPRSCLDAELVETLLHLRLEDLADVDLGDPHVAVRVALRRLRAARDRCGPRRARALGDDGHAVAPAVAEALDDRADQRVDDRLEPQSASGTLPGSASASRRRPCRCRAPDGRPCGPSRSRSTSATWSSRPP